MNSRLGRTRRPQRYTYGCTACLFALDSKLVQPPCNGANPQRIATVAAVGRVASQKKHGKGSSRRDEFPAAVILRLRQRVNDRCSNPDCRTPTSAPGDGELDVSSIGVAAHIHAAAKGGPRYLSSLSTDQRRGIQNGIWLCWDCSVKVDRSPKQFAADLLRAWKTQAEQRASTEQGRRLPTHEDAVDQVAMVLGAAPARLVPSAIGNAHRATAVALERLDSRFRVETAFDQGLTRYTLNALEKVPFNIQVEGDTAQSWIEGLAALEDHAREARLPMVGASITGSKLLDTLMSGLRPGSGHLIVTPHPRRASVYVTFSPPGADRWKFEEIRGGIFVGKKTARFEGAACNAILQLRVELPVTSELRSTCNVTFGTDFESWEDRLVTELPYAERMLRIAEALVAETPLSLEIDIDGRRIAAGGNPNFPAGARSAFAQLAGFLDYANLASRLAVAVGQQLRYRSAPIEQVDYQQLAQVVAWIEGEEFASSDMLNDPVARMSGSAAAELCAGATEWRDARLELPLSSIRVYGSELPLPVLIVYLVNVRIHVDEDAIAGSDEVAVRFERGPKFRLIRGLHRQDDSM
jgi:hypothetical protein